MEELQFHTSFILYFNEQRSLKKWHISMVDTLSSFASISTTSVSTSSMPALEREHKATQSVYQTYSSVMPVFLFFLQTRKTVLSEKKIHMLNWKSWQSESVLVVSHIVKVTNNKLTLQPGNKKNWKHDAGKKVKD